MRILFLDDNERRIDLARSNFELDTLAVARTADEAIGYLGFEVGNNTWDLIMLDHDLGGEANGWGAGNEKTGMDVVRWIIANNPIIDRVVVHSWNPMATYMVDMLVRAGYKAEWKRFQILK